MSKCVRANVSIRANVRTEWFSYGQMCETPIGKLKLPYGITQYYMPCLDPSLTCQYSILPPRRDGRLSWLVLVIFLEENSVHRDGFPHKAWTALKIWSWGNEGRRGKRKSTESNKFFCRRANVDLISVAVASKRRSGESKGRGPGRKVRGLHFSLLDKFAWFQYLKKQKNYR